MRIEEIGELFDRIAECYPHFSGDTGTLKTWHRILRQVPYDRACENLLQYAAKPENRYPPHPGMLAASDTDEADRYHEYMRDAGREAVGHFERSGVSAAIPTPEQRRKVREQLAKSRPR